MTLVRLILQHGSGWLRLLRRILLGGLLIGVCACKQEYVEHEIGYKGRARVNPWLAAEQFARKYDLDVTSLAAWRAPMDDDGVWFVPASMLNNESFIRRVDVWAHAGGHLVVLVENASAETNDWRGFEPELPPAQALLDMLQRAGIGLAKNTSAHDDAATAEMIRLNDEEFKVHAKSHGSVTLRGSDPGVFASALVGTGRISVLMDARPLRNRWIANNEHAKFLLALIEVTGNRQSVVFVRGSGLSFWAMAGKHLWPVLCGLALLLGLWLWKNLCRFGPLEAEAMPAAARGYDHHLEALGNFHWRLDRAASLVSPLREQLLERGQRICPRSARMDEDFLLLLAARSGLSKARVSQALAAPIPADTLIATRTAADLQVLLKALS